MTPSCATSTVSAAAAAPSLVNADKDAYAPRYVQHQPAPQRMLPTLAEWAAARAAALTEGGSIRPLGAARRRPPQHQQQYGIARYRQIWRDYSVTFLQYRPPERNL